MNIDNQESLVILTNPETRSKILKGVNLLADTVKVTLGTKGRLVMYNKYRDFDDPEGYPCLTKDGVTVARQVQSSDPVIDMVIKIIRESAKETVESSGDGPQPLYSKVLTPSGFVEMGSLKAGDVICGINGSFQQVVETFDKGEKEIYEVVFSDGRIVECCEDHLWTFTTCRGTVRTIPIKNIINNTYYTKSNGNKQYKFFTPRTKVDFEHKPISIDPYLLGLLIGDGSLSGTGDIELSLGVSKHHVLSHIPESIKFSCKFVEEKNYFRVKFKDEILKKQLDALGLFGTKSSTKFIPKNYLYNDAFTREELLQGLLDTDGHINKRNLFEYSTVSNQLSEDFIELVRSLGITVNYKLQNRDNDVDSYSNTSIHRIIQLKGYKYGDKIIEVRRTRKLTSMRCIKVSNEDNLYITDNYIVTHNTTSTTILAQKIINEGFKLLDSGISSWEFNKYADKAVEDIIKTIRSNSIPVDDDVTKIRQIATISANNEDVGIMIGDIFEAIGTHGDIDIRKGRESETFVELTKGMKLHKGYFSAEFCIDKTRMTWERSGVNILVYDETIRDYADIQEFIQASISPDGSLIPLLIYCQDISDMVLKRLKFTSQTSPRPIMFVEHDGFGDRREMLLDDLCALTGAVPVDNKTTIQDHSYYLGFCEEVKVTQHHTFLIGGTQDDNLMKMQKEEILDKIENGDLSKNELKFFKKRLGNLDGGIAVINVGGENKVEVDEQTDRIEDAVLAAKSAIQEGISLGGGFAWYKASINRNHEEHNRVYNMIHDSLMEILKQLLTNSQEDELYDTVVDAMKHDRAYNLMDRSFYDTSNYPVFDATSVLIDSIKNSVAVAKSILAIERCIFKNQVIV